MLVRALLAFLVLPGVVAFVVPLGIAAADGSRAAIFAPGVPVVLAGVVLLLWCVRDFYVAGKGTLAPWDPPRRIVVIGLYRHVRNPMYVSVMVIVAGWAVLFTSWWIAAYAVVLAIAFHLRVLLYEEPWLERQFGDDWRRYRARVSRWLPRVARDRRSWIRPGSLAARGAVETSRMPTLYYAPHTCALATHLALEHAGAPYELVRVDLATQQQRSPDYLKLNPKGRVPALVTARGILTETPALLQFVAQSWPAARLLPLDDPFLLAEANAFASYLCATVHVAHAHRMRGARWADDPAAWAAMQRKVPQSVGDAFAPIEQQYLRGPYVLGDALSACDYYLLTLARWLEADGVDPSRLPRVLDHRRRMLELPLVQRVIAAEEGA